MRRWPSPRRRGRNGAAAAFRGKRARTDGATLDELLARIKTELTKLGPILDLEVVREPEGSKRRAA